MTVFAVKSRVSLLEVSIVCN